MIGKLKNLYLFLQQTIFLYFLKICFILLLSIGIKVLIVAIPMSFLLKILLLEILL